MADVVTIMYGVMLAMFIFMFLIILIWVAGKDIVSAFKRKIWTKGVDVYIVGSTRNIDYSYKVPKDGIIRSNKLPYVTNPDKILNLNDQERIKAFDYLLKREQRLKKRIKEIQDKINNLLQMQSIAKTESQKMFYNSQIEHYKTLKRTFEGKIQIKQENYFKDKRPAFFYLEGDPIPKDFHEFMSLIDSRMVDNLVSRAITQPQTAKVEADIKTLKLFLLLSAGAGAVAAFFAFRNNSLLLAICEKVGAACS